MRIVKYRNGVVLTKVMDEDDYLILEELWPCKDFECYHDSLTCGQALICPVSTKMMGNKYSGICVPQCLDCKKYTKCRGSKKAIKNENKFNPSHRDNMEV